MRVRKQSFVLVGMCSAMGLVACGSDDDAPADPMPAFVEPSAETQAVWGQIQGYQSWDKFPATPGPTLSEGHSNMYVVSYYNDVVKTAMGSSTLPLPDGAILVKDNFTSADAASPMALTVMAKQDGAWYWLQATPDGKTMVDMMMEKGTPLEGKSVKMCTSCHTSAKDDNDWVLGHDFSG